MRTPESERRDQPNDQLTNEELLVIQACQRAIQSRNSLPRSAKFSRVMAQIVLGPDECLKAIDRRLRRGATGPKAKSDTPEGI